MKILITGGAGYIGLLLIPMFLQHGFDVTVYDSFLCLGSSLLPFISNPDFTFIKGDIRDKSALNQAIKSHDLIIHLAAVVGLSACNKKPISCLFHQCQRHKECRRKLLALQTPNLCLDR